MLSIPESIADAIRARSGVYVPATFLDIYADIGPMDSISSASHWAAVNDPALANDTNVDFTRRPGLMVLAAGAYVAPVHAGTNTQVTNLSVTIKRVDRYHYKGTLGKLGGSSYGYDGTDFSITQIDNNKYQTFTAANTQIIDNLIVAANYSGSNAMPTKVRIINVATGNQVGTAVSFTPNASVTNHTLSGFAAGIVAGRVYRVEFTATPPSSVGYLLGGPGGTRHYTSRVHLYGYTPVSTTWRIPFGTGFFMATGGRPNYTTTGNFQRTLNVGSIPSDTGTLSISDVVPTGTTMLIAGYYTDSDVVAAEVALTNWTLFSAAVASGATLPAHKYWRFDVTMTATTAQDKSPELHAIYVRYAPPPIVLGTTAQIETLIIYNGLTWPLTWPLTYSRAYRKRQVGYKALNNVSSSSAALSPQFSGSMIGSLTAGLAPEPIVNALYNKPLKGRRVDVRIGYVGIEETIRTYSGSVDDISFKSNMYQLDIADTFVLADVSIPATKAGPEWADATAYGLNDVTVHGAASYICIQAHTSSGASEPGVGGSWATYWDINGTVWANVIYNPTTSGGGDWHLADIITDILTNRINIPTERIDLASIAAVKAALPNRTGERILTKPTKAKGLLGELAWLLESQFVVRDGLFSLVKEPASTDEAVEAIVGQDIIKNSLKLRRGYRELVNQAVIVTGYAGDGEGSDKFSKGEVGVDATSQTDYDVVVQKDWQDKWNVPASELQLRNTAVLDRYANGRRVLSCSVVMRLLPVEPGDVVTLDSGQLPPADPGPLKCLVIGKKMAFSKQTIALGLLEV